MAARGLLDPEKEDPFNLFVASTNIRYCYYSETHNILGNTFGMCVLQVRAGPGVCHLSLRRSSPRSRILRSLLPPQQQHAQLRPGP